MSMYGVCNGSQVSVWLGTAVWSVQHVIMTTDGSVLNDLFILNESLMWLKKNESSQGVFRSVAHAHHPIGSVLE